MPAESKKEPPVPEGRTHLAPPKQYCCPIHITTNATSNIVAKHRGLAITIEKDRGSSRRRNQCFRLMVVPDAEDDAFAYAANAMQLGRGARQHELMRSWRVRRPIAAKNALPWAVRCAAFVTRCIASVTSGTCRDHVSTTW